MLRVFRHTRSRTTLAGAAGVPRCTHTYRSWRHLNGTWTGGFAYERVFLHYPALQVPTTYRATSNAFLHLLPLPSRGSASLHCELLP